VRAPRALLGRGPVIRRPLRLAIALGVGAVLCGARAGAAAESDHFDEMMPRLLHDFGIPGASLAIVYEGRLVLARGYGLADVTEHRAVEATTPFLIASVSKTITAATVLALVQQRRLQLNDKVLRILDDLQPPPHAKVDPRLADITVRDLLYHAGGWDRRVSGDPMTSGDRIESALHVQAPVTPRDLARYMLGQPLDFKPGTKTAYSNFGYMLLGMIIERVTGQPYADYVRANTLAPMGITAMVNGAGLDSYLPNQARRYGPNDWWVPRGGLAPVHFASGAWIGSAVDLARFMAVIGGSRPPPLLTPATFELMLSAPPPPIAPHSSGSHLGMGWDVVQQTPDGVLYWKNGGVLGTTAWVEHRPKHIDWVLLLDGSLGKPRGPELRSAFLHAIRHAIDTTTTWPDGDLFQRYQ
jgi:N-acyl-D-amino-acid deacylase